MRSAIRVLLRRPVFTLTAVLTIALGIGANTALFGVIYSVLLRPLPFRDPARLVQIWETHPALPQLQVTYPDFQDWQKQSRSYEQIAAHTLSAMNNGTLLGQGDPVPIHATMASVNLFSAMGIEPLAGRAFSVQEDTGRQRVALISENLWRTKFGADSGIIGRQIRLDADSFRVIGIVPQEQAFPAWADMWIPLSLMEPQLQNRRKFHPLEVVARLRPGVSVQQADSEIRTIARRTTQAYPDTSKQVGAYVIPLDREITQSVRPSLLLAWAAVGLVLLIACANLAHLILAQMIERRQELAIREALGARASHLIRQLMTESLLVTALGGLVGVGLAALGSELLRTLASSQIPRLEHAALPAPVWLFSIAVSLIASVLFGLPACWQVLRSRSRLLESGRTIAHGRSRFSAVLLAAEVAMAVLVLSGAALLTRSFASLLSEDPGFQAKQVWTIPNLALRNNWTQSAEFVSTRLAPALRNVPGVIDVAAINSAPMTLAATEHSRYATRFGVEGRTFDTGSYPVAQNRWCTPGFFHVLEIPLVRGRLLSDSDRGKPTIVVNQTLARRLFPGQDPVGKRLVFGVLDPKQSFGEIVGVVGDVHDMGLDQDVEPTVYGIFTGPVMDLVVKTAAGSNISAAAITGAIHQVDPEIPVTKIHQLEQNVSDSLARRRFILILLAIFGAMAAFLTAAGIYGLITQSVNARVREFGVRAAVGAAPGELVMMILREALTLTMPGLIAGLVLSLFFARLLKTLVYQVSPVDPISIASAGLFLVLLTFLSAWLPAARAAAVDPAVALRAE